MSRDIVMALLHSVQSLYLIVCLLCCLALNASAVAVNYTEPICGLTDLYDGDYTQDKKGPPVCFVLTNPDDATKKKTIFWPTVDEFSLLEVDECKYMLAYAARRVYANIHAQP